MYSLFFVECLLYVYWTFLLGTIVPRCTEVIHRLGSFFLARRLSTVPVIDRSARINILQVELLSDLGTYP